MLWLHFLVGDRLFFDGEWEDQEEMEEVIRTHLGVEDRDRYEVHREREERKEGKEWKEGKEEEEEEEGKEGKEGDPTVVRVWVEDRATWDRFVGVDRFPCSVTAEQPRRTVWINPPSEEEKLGTERSCPWNTHYTEYIQIYHAGLEEKKMYTVKYWKRLEDVELYDPTPLARARHAYLRSLVSLDS